MTDFLAEKRQEINDRLAELKPLIDEYTQLEAAAKALAGVGGSSTRSAPAAAPAAAAPVRRGPGRPRGSKSRKTTGTARRGRPPAAPKAAAAVTTSATPRRRAGRRKGSGTRAAQALTFVTGSPASPSPSLPPRWASSRTTSTACFPPWSRKRRSRSKAGAGTQPADLPPDSRDGRCRALRPGRSRKGQSRERGQPCATRRRGLDQALALTVARSSSNSATDASIFARENASRSRPCTIDHSPFEQVHGKPLTRPSGTP